MGSQQRLNGSWVGGRGPCDRRLDSSAQGSVWPGIAGEHTGGAARAGSAFAGVEFRAATTLNINIPDPPGRKTRPHRAHRTSPGVRGASRSTPEEGRILTQPIDARHGQPGSYTSALERGRAGESGGHPDSCQAPADVQNRPTILKAVQINPSEKTGISFAPVDILK
jgi:hypothetical protein